MSAGTPRSWLHPISLSKDGLTGRAALCLSEADPAQAAMPQSPHCDLLHDNERRRLDEMRFERRRDSYWLGRCCAKRALAAIRDIAPQRIEIASGVWGQPIVVGEVPGQPVQVSISHSAAIGAAVAFDAAFPMGVDVESPDSVARLDPARWSCEEERRQWLSGDDALLPALLWSAKEAVAKVLHSGLSAPPELLRIERLREDAGLWRYGFRHLPHVEGLTLPHQGQVLSLAFPKDSLDVGQIRGLSGLAKAGDRPRVVFMFSGQGSQYYQMGRELFEHDPIFAEHMRHGARTLERLSGVDLLQVIYAGGRPKTEPFVELGHTHPALFLIQYALARTLLDKGVRPDLLLGASLGEFVAIAVAEAVPFEQAAGMVLEHARLVAEHSPRGAMIAVLASPELYRSEPRLHRLCELAGENFDRHFVIALPLDTRLEVKRILAEHGVSHQELPVQYAFHSSQMDRVCSEYALRMAGVAPRPPRWPVLSCASGAYLGGDLTDHLARLARAPIDFRATVQRLLSQGDCLLLDLGPSGTLATHARYGHATDAGFKAVSAMTPFGNDVYTLNQTLDAFAAL
ncbi:4'-phosphopantetheinyl transferase superfamily protein [Lysobacter sp. yr284]|uniref:acyltransferase domain-containing protein n=1 Tax=Lysobacter sp. yr284 TaxID=1761791 RepID=UPI000896488A|nr:acyltransferase domain-containing protein [Lysobacter sp. yr284]SDY35991.1 4'-phosphopantetheinyl transferase superfamily protein [Lysobacter sp. yr284]